MPAAADPQAVDPQARSRRRAAQRARLWLTAAAIAGYLPVLGVPLRRWLDFAAFYVGGQLVGTMSLLDPQFVAARQVLAGLPPTPFVSPPFVALAYAPLAALPYDLAALIQVAVMLAALLGGAALWGDALGLPRRWAVLGALAWGPASASVVSGQVDTLLLLLSGLAVRFLATERRVPAGLAVALLACKPQVAIGAGLGAVRRLGAAGLASVAALGAVLYGLSAIAVGGDLLWPRAWLATLASYSTKDFAANGWQASSPVSLGVRWWLASSNPILLIAGVAVGAVIVGVVLGALSTRRAHEPLAALGAGTGAKPGAKPGTEHGRTLAPSSAAAEVAIGTALWLVVSPHLWVYDATLVLPAIGLWAAAANRAGWPRSDVLWLAGTFAAAALWPVGGVLGLTPLPVIVAGVPILLARALGLLGHGAARGRAGMFPTDSPT